MAEHERSKEIRQFILHEVEGNSEDIVTGIAKKFQITKRAANMQLSRLVSEGILEAAGNKRNRSYSLKILTQWSKGYPISPDVRDGLTEDNVWDEVRPILGDLPENLIDIWSGAVTEMFNNVLSHSEGGGASVEIKRTAINTEISVYDNGVGIFKKIQTAKNLSDPRHAILELSKGKLTTDPEHHSGQGIFFTSRMFDWFDILSQGLYFTHESEGLDVLTQRDKTSSGTAIWMKIANDSKRTTKEIYDQFADPENDDYGFARTIVPVKLAKYSGDRLVSRSQAKMVLAGLDKFSTVVFDFKDVETIGQGFADEIFRVFAKAHPEMTLRSLHVNDRVNGMVQMAVAERRETEN
jgi:anti-sigma regulatory factor (Ser/Thr protein kinase)